MTFSLQTDVEERLFSPVTPVEDEICQKGSRLLLARSRLLREYAGEFKNLFSSNTTAEVNFFFGVIHV